MEIIGALFLSCLVIIWVESCSSRAEVEIVTVDVNESKHLIFSGNHRYLDVRTEEEFKKGHVGVDNAFNIPYMFNTPGGRVKNPKFLEQVLSAFNKDDNLVVGCQSGVRSVYATTDLLKAEFKHVYNMGGGYLDWVANGFTVKIPQTEETIKAETDTKTKEETETEAKVETKTKTETKAKTEL